MAANFDPILLFRPCPGSVALFATKMVRLVSLTLAAPEVPILEVHFPNDSPVDLIGQTRVPTKFIVFLKDLRTGVLNPASEYQIYNLTPDEGIQKPAAAAWLTLGPVIAIAVEAYNKLVHGV